MFFWHKKAKEYLLLYKKGHNTPLLEGLFQLSVLIFSVTKEAGFILEKQVIIHNNRRISAGKNNVPLIPSALNCFSVFFAPSK